MFEAYTQESEIPTAREANQHIRESLIRYLCQCAETGKTATFVDMSELLHIDFLGSSTNRSRITRAIDAVLKDYGHVFRSVRGVGYQPMTTDEVSLIVGQKSRKKIEGVTQRWRNQYSAVSVSELSQASLAVYLKEGLRLLSQEEINSTRHSAKIDAIVEKQSQQLTKDRLKEILQQANHELSNIG